METATISINMDSDAFADEPMTELARILRKLANDVEQRGAFGLVRDINGNRCGVALLEGGAQ